MKKKHFAFAVLATMLASCANNDDPVAFEKDTPIAIASAGVNELVASRSATPLTDGSLGLYVTGTDLDSKYTATNVEWKYATDGWVNQGETLLFAGEGKQSAYAYHPYNADAYADGFTTDGATDLLWWKSESALTAAEFPIGFTHALPKLTIELKKGTEVAADVTISEVKVLGTKLTATPDFAAQTWTATDDAEATDIAATATTTTTGMDATYTVLLIPQETSVLRVVITTSDSRVFAYTHSGTHEFVAGTAYTLNLKVGGDNVEAGTISANVWGTPTTSGETLETE